MSKASKAAEKLVNKFYKILWPVEGKGVTTGLTSAVKWVEAKQCAELSVVETIEGIYKAIGHPHKADVLVYPWHQIKHEILKL